MSSDEPLYCPYCGNEIGDGCECQLDVLSQPLPPREKRYCEVCGVVPAIGGECHFYKPGGNSKGCDV